MYSFATATAWILLEALGTVRLTVCLSSSFNIEGILMGRVGQPCTGGSCGQGQSLYYAQKQ